MAVNGRVRFWLVFARFAVVVCASLMAQGLFAQVIVEQGQTPPPAGGRERPAVQSDPLKYIVRFVPGTAGNTKAAAVQGVGASVRHNLPIINGFSITLPNAQAATALMNNPNVLHLNRDYVVSTAAKAVTPDDPQNLTAAAGGSSQVQLNWDASANEEGYEVERCSGGGCSNFVQVATTGLNQTSYLDQGLSGSTVYQYRVRAFITSGPPGARNSGYSNTAGDTTSSGSPPPLAPSGLTATTLSTTEIDLSWTDNSTDEDTFQIERCEGAGCSSFGAAGSVGPGITSFSDSGLTPNTTYRYRVFARHNTNGNSGFSNIDTATTLDDAPPPPPPSFGGTQQFVSVSVQRVGIPTATSNGAGIGVAVLDTGCDYNHRDLIGALAPDNPGVTSLNTFVPGGSAQDDRGHGTHVTGLIAARNNNFDILGIAPESTVYCVKVLDSTGFGDESNSIAGLQWVFDNHDLVDPPIEVVNMSLGRALEAGEEIDSTPMLPAVQALYNIGIPVVVSAGGCPKRR